MLLALELLLAHAGLVYAQSTTAVPKYNSGVSDQIAKFLCAPTEPTKSSQQIIPSQWTNGSPSGSALTLVPSTGQAATNNTAATDLYTCINKLYRFAIAGGSVMGILFIVVAGYLYMASDGNQESVDKAKSIFTSSITAMVILFAGYVLLRAINPDLLKFQSIQPPSIVPTTITCPTGAIASSTGVCVLPSGAVVAPISTGLPAGCTINYCNIYGYNMASYTHDAGYQSLIISIYNGMSKYDFTSASGIDAYMKKAVPSTPLTGSMVINASQSYGNVDPKMIVAIMQADSSLGTAGYGATDFNPGNIKYAGQAGATQGPKAADGGYFANFGNWQTGVSYVSKWLHDHPA